MSLVLKIVIPVLIIGGLVWLYMAKYPSMAANSQPAPQQQQVQTETPEQAAARSTTDAQLDADLVSLDSDIKSADDASASIDQADQPIAQTE